MVAKALEILNPGGILILSTNAANVLRKFKKQIEKGFQGRSIAIWRIRTSEFSMEQEKKVVIAKVFTIKGWYEISCFDYMPRSLEEAQR